MITTLFILGAIMALACALNITFTPSRVSRDVVWSIGFVVGACAMAGAIYLASAVCQ